MSKRRARDQDDSVLMPPPATSISARGLPHSEGSRPVAPTPSPRHPSVSRPVFGRYSSTGPKRRSALDNIGYVPEDIPTPRIRPFSTALGTSTGKRRRGLKFFDAAATSPVRPAKPVIQSPSKHTAPSTLSAEADDDDYIVDSSDDEAPVRFNLPPEDLPRSSKIPRTSVGNTSVRDSTRPGPTPTSRLGPGATPARHKDLAARLGITPARAGATATPKTPGAQINTAPIRLNLTSTRARPVFRPTVPSEASPFVSPPFRARVVPTRPKPAEEPTRIAQVETTPGSKRVFSSSGAQRVVSVAVAARPPSPTPAGTKTKRAPGSKSTSPGAPGPKRPRVAAPSPPALEEVIIVSSSDDDEPEKQAEIEERPEEIEIREERRPSPSPSLGGYRFSPDRSVRSRARSTSASSDVVLLESPIASTAKRVVPTPEEPPARDPPRKATPEPVPPPEDPSKRPSIPKDVPRPVSPPTPSPSRHSSSSSERAKASGKSVEIIESSDSLRPFRGRRVVPGRGRRKRLNQREPQSPEPVSEHETSPEQVSPLPVDSLPEPLPEPITSPFKRPGSAETSPPKREESPPRITLSPSPWTGQPLFRPSTIASGLTPLRDSPAVSIRPTPGPSKPRNVEPIKSPEVDRESALGDDPLQAMYSPDRRIFGTPQYLVMGPPRPPRVFPSESPGPSIFSYAHISVSSVPPSTVPSTSLAARRIRKQMDCVLLPRASKAVRRALEREQQRTKKNPGLTISIPTRKDKGKAKDLSEYPASSEFEALSSDTSSVSSSWSPSTAGPAPQPPVIKYLVIDPRLALRETYESLPPEIEESPDKYCHCCRTRSGAGKLKMRCASLSRRRRRNMGGNGPHECGLYWCQRCIAKHDMPFNPLLDNFKCPFCSGICECDVCRRDRGQEKLGRWAVKVVTVKPGKRTLDAIVKGRSALGSMPANTAVGPSNPADESAGPSNPLPPEPEFVESSPSESNPIAGPSTITAPEPAPTPAPAPEPVEVSSNTDPEPESPKVSAPPAVPAPPPDPAPSNLASVERGPTTWHGRHTPPPLRHRRTSGGHALSTEAHIFIPRGPREPVPDEREDEDEESVEEDESVWGDKHQAFEGDYSAVEASLLGADSGAFEFEHGSVEAGRETEGGGIVGVEAGAGDLGLDARIDVPGVIDTGDLVAEGESEPLAAHTPVNDASRGPSPVLGGILAYPPSESSEGSQIDAPIEMPTVPVETTTHTITGTLDDHPPVGVLDPPATSAPDGPPGEISHDTLTRIFNESVQGFDESEAEHDYGPTAPSRPAPEIDELHPTPAIDEPRLPTPDLDEIRAAFGDDTIEHEELTSDLGQLHPEGTFEAVPRISMGGGGGLTIHGSLQDIPLFNAVMDRSDEMRDLALPSSQTERALSTVCGSLLDQARSYPFDLERLAIPELEDSESDEPDLVPATDPESSKSTILETPSPQFEPDIDADTHLAKFQSLFDSGGPRTTSFVLPAEENPVHIRKVIQSHFTQQVEPEIRTTRSQTRKSIMERGKFLRSKRCYGAAL